MAGLVNTPMLDSGFWQGRRVLVTGHTGFKGSWLCLWLDRLGAKVSGLSLDPPTEPNMFGATRVGRVLERDIRADIRDRELVNTTVKDLRPDILFHLAAQPIVRRSYLDPVGTYESNIIGLVNVLEAVRKGGSVNAVINVTSDKCYENREWVWAYRENEAVGGDDPYSSSKGCAELVTNAYRRSFLRGAGIHIGSARAGNVIGGGDWGEDRLLPDILRAVAGGFPIELRAPRAIRPWQHVLEPLFGYMKLAQALRTEGERFSDAWNFGPDDAGAKSVEWVVRTYAAGKADLDWAFVGKEQPHEAHFLMLANAKSKAYLNWRPAWNICTAIAKTRDWHDCWLRSADTHDLTLKQISEYESVVANV